MAATTLGDILALAVKRQGESRLEKAARALAISRGCPHAGITAHCTGSSCRQTGQCEVAITDDDRRDAKAVLAVIDAENENEGAPLDQ